jgi:hypothetical protein
MPYKDPNCEAAIASRKAIAARYYQKTKEKQLELNKTDPRRLKTLRINNWKKRGIIGDYDELYEKWLNITECEECGYVFTDTKNKCLDHDHDTGLFRFILCRNCNNDEKFKSV